MHIQKKISNFVTLSRSRPNIFLYVILVFSTHHIVIKVKRILIEVVNARSKMLNLATIWESKIAHSPMDSESIKSMVAKAEIEPLFVVPNLC